MVPSYRVLMIEEGKIVNDEIVEMPYHQALSIGFEVFMTGGTIDAAIEAYLKGELVSDQRRVHNH